MAVLVIAAFFMVWICLSRIPKGKRAAMFKRWWTKFYNICMVLPLIRNSIRKISSKLAYLSVYRPDEIPALSARFFLISSGASIAAALAGIFLCPDAVTACLCFIFAVILHDVMTDKQLDKVYLTVLRDSVRMLSSVEQSYLRTNSIPDALINCAELPKLMRKPIDEIYDAIAGADGEMKLEQFIASTPFRPLQTFAGVCRNLSIHGDSTDTQGISGFIRAITILRGDVNSEIERLTLQKSKFGVMEYLPLAAIIGIGPLENFLIGTIPGMAIMYKSILGFIMRSVVMILAIAGYVVISRINSVTTVKPDDRSALIERILKKKSVFVKNIIPKKPIKQARIKRSLNVALSKMDLRHLYCKKAVFAAGTFLAALCILAFSVGLGRSFIHDTTAQLSLVGGTIRTDDEQAKMRTMDEIYFENDGRFSDTELKILIRRYLPKLTDMQFDEEMKRMRDKFAAYQALYFRFWFVFCAFGAAVVGWFIPDILLKFRAKFG
jgi:hypothetical protein